MSDIPPQAVLTLITEQHIVDTTEPLAADTDLFACGLDSLAMMQLMLHLENRFAVRIPPAEMTRERFASAEALAAWMTRLTRSAA